MGRTLPWKKTQITSTTKDRIRRNDPSSSSDTLPHPSPPSRPARYRPEPGVTAPKKLHTRDIPEDDFEPSPSPPKPVAESLMIPGIRNDDRWRMVEDEFVAIAHKFTAHLHAAEYERRKREAREQNADPMRSLARPVVGAMTDRVKREKAVLALKRSQQSSLKQARLKTKHADEDTDEEQPWAGAALEGLMDSPRKKRVPLSKVVATASDTRAAALSRKNSSVYKSSQRSNASQHHRPSTLTRKRSVRSEEGDSDDDTLGTQSSTHRAKRLAVGTSSSAPASRRATPAIPSRTPSAVTERGARAPAPRVLPAPAPLPRKPTPTVVSNAPDDDSDSSLDLGFSFGNRIKKR